MRLKELGQAVGIADEFKQVLSTASLFTEGNLGAKNYIANGLAQVAEKYDTDLLKLAVSQAKLNKSQAEAIYIKKGLKGEELALAIQTTAVSEAEEIATASTGGLTAVFKGLWATLKANPLLGVAGVIGMIVSLVSA